MTTYLHDLFELTLLDDMLNDGYVVARDHPSLPLKILNYSPKTQYDKVWNPVTRQCRGLIYDTTSFEVIARPYSKFHNHGEVEAAHLKLDVPAIVTDKQDGSLGILYPTGDGSYAIATRGSFTSDQALHATQMWKDRYEDEFTPMLHTTYLFEIVYPENKIVLDYQDKDDLILLGMLDIGTGNSYPPTAVPDWPGPVTEIFPATTLAEALTMPPRKNAEGVVVHYPDTNERLKVKQEDYVRLHSILFGLNARTVWESMMADGDIEELIAPLPDEFHDWVRKVVAKIETNVNDNYKRIIDAYGEIISQLHDGWERKDFARLAATHPLKWALFLLLDERDIQRELLKRAKPEAFQLPMAAKHTEDTA